MDVLRTTGSVSTSSWNSLSTGWSGTCSPLASTRSRWPSSHDSRSSWSSGSQPAQETFGEAQVTARDKAGVVAASYEAIPGAGTVLTRPRACAAGGTRRLGTRLAQDKAGSAGTTKGS